MKDTIKNGDVYKETHTSLFVLFENVSSENLTRVWLDNGAGSNSLSKESWEEYKIEENWEHVGNITELLVLYGKALEAKLGD